MKFSIYCIGKLKEAYLREGVAEFVKRTQPYGGVTITELPESKLGDKPSPSDKQKALYEEGQRLLKYCTPQSFVVLLDVYGKQMRSEDLAKHISELEVQGHSEMVFFIGGAFGVSEELRQRAQWKLSISPMTFTHQMVRLVLVEQLYRACKINRNEPYHW